MTHASLSTHLTVYKQVRAQIAQEFSLDEDDLAVTDTAEGETDLVDYLTRLMREARYAAAMAKGLADLQKTTAERKARLEAKHDRLKSIVLHAMADADLPKLAAPDFTASRTRAQAPLIVTDEAQVPDEYCRHKREVDKVKLRDAIKAGAAFECAFLGNPAEVLTVRSS